MMEFLFLSRLIKILTNEDSENTLKFNVEYSNFFRIRNSNCDDIFHPPTQMIADIWYLSHCH